MQWSGIWKHAVVGYTDSGDYYENHPASGYEIVDTVVACKNQFCGDERSNLVYKLSQSIDFVSQQMLECNKKYNQDTKETGDFAAIQDIASLLEPCPCTLWQAWRDWGRFRSQSNLCFVQRTSPMNTSYTQQCCYAPWG